MSTTLDPQILGRAENAHRALLGRLLARTALGAMPDPYRAWVALALLARSEHPVDVDRFVAELGRSLGTGISGVRSIIDGLAHAGLIDTEQQQAAPTADGRAVRDDVQARIAAAIGPLYAELDDRDAAAAARALTHVTRLIDATLAAG
jgi:DNA-binding MarR family transcriptional regulator